MTTIAVKYALLFLMSVMTLPCMAQSPFLKIVKAISTDVALHQKPSTSSPVLVYKEDEMESLYADWSSNKNEEGVDVTFLPILKEEGEWYKAQYEEQTVYVMKKSCKDVVLRSLPQDETVLTTGDYKGYCFSMGESFGGFKIQIGRYVNGMYVFEYSTWANAYNEGETTMDEENGFNFNVKYTNEYQQPDLSKILADPKLLSFVMSKLDKMKHDKKECLFGIVGDEEIYSVSIPIK